MSRVAFMNKFGRAKNNQLLSKGIHCMYGRRYKLVEPDRSENNYENKFGIFSVRMPTGTEFRQILG